MFKLLELVYAGKKERPQEHVTHTTVRTDTTVIPPTLPYHLYAASVQQSTTVQPVLDLMHLNVCLVHPTWNVLMHQSLRITQYAAHPLVFARGTSLIQMELVNPVSLLARPVESCQCSHVTSLRLLDVSGKAISL